MKFLIIIPTHNEEDNILQCLNSLKNQTFKNFKCIIVNDHSTDQTKMVVENFLQQEETKTQFQIIDKISNQASKNTHSPGAKVVETFNFGLNSTNIDNFDIICKFDADIIFPENYLEKINEVYENQPNTGMVSGLVYILKNGEWQFENLSSKNHIRGPIKSYRKECFQAMKGLRSTLGWDNIDVMLCQMYGYNTHTIKELWVKHLRPTAYKYKQQKAQKLGEYFYNIGLNFPLATISSLKSSLKNKSFSEFFITMRHFLKQNKKRELSLEETQFIRNLRWKEIWKKLY